MTPPLENRSFIQALTEISATQQDRLGTIRKEGSKWYKYVQYEQGAAAVAGVADEICYYDATDGYRQNLVTSDVSDSDDFTAGQLMASLTDGDYGWIQIQGLSNVLPIDVIAGNVGDALTAVGIGASDGTLDVALGVAEHIAGILVVATGSSQQMCLTCPI